MKAFISSTSKDLGEYRRAAYDACLRLSILPIGMEQFESMGVGATAGSLHKLDEAAREAVDYGFGVKASGAWAMAMRCYLLWAAAQAGDTGARTRIAELGLLAGSRMHAGRVRDPQFANERRALADAFEQWLAAPVPDWQAAASLLRATTDPDARRAYKDLVSARWSAKGRWADWKHLVSAALADATALDFVLGRFAGHVLREHRDGLREFPDAALAEAISICAKGLATSRPWELGPPAYG